MPQNRPEASAATATATRKPAMNESVRPAPSPAKPYPRAGVFWISLLCGAPLGALWLGGATFFAALVAGEMSFSETFAGVLVLPFFLIFGTVLGFVPAAVLACILTLWRPYRSAANTFLTAAAGAAVSALFGFVLPYLGFGGDTPSADSFVIYTFALAGGLSAATLARLVLPKPNDE
ncbi:hypothetical protein HMPREF9120_00176 [Neisseria sp. oral taxon 020 str. F0370]|nr:hypothetical protein CGZ77_10095 [Neisseria sp. KEM232]EKY09950.1 hypothetical protein HMPREF9120_00176 [Neisseria sp. oral taxon 020 str. F0370]